MADDDDDDDGEEEKQLIDLLCSAAGKKATKYWECVECQKFTVESFGDGKYILCPSCKKWCHWNCSGLGDEPTQEVEDAWHCKKCPGTSQRVTRGSRK